MSKLFKNPIVLLRGIIALLYVALGIYLCLNPYYLYFVQRTYRIILAGGILAYGLFRFYRFYTEYASLGNEEE